MLTEPGRKYSNSCLVCTLHDGLHSEMAHIARTPAPRKSVTVFGHDHSILPEHDSAPMISTVRTLLSLCSTPSKKCRLPHSMRISPRLPTPNQPPPTHMGQCGRVHLCCMARTSCVRPASSWCVGPTAKTIHARLLAAEAHQTRPKPPDHASSEARLLYSTVHAYTTQQTPPPAHTVPTSARLSQLQAHRETYQGMCVGDRVCGTRAADLGGVIPIAVWLILDSLR